MKVRGRKLDDGWMIPVPVIGLKTAKVENIAVQMLYDKAVSIRSLEGNML